MAAAHTGSRAGPTGATGSSTLVRRASSGNFMHSDQVIVKELPSGGAPTVRKLFKGQSPHGHEQTGWVRLDAASTRPRNDGYEGTASWVPIDRRLGMDRPLKQRQRQQQQRLTTEAGPA